MWKAAAGHKISSKAARDDDDWETDPNFVVSFDNFYNKDVNYKLIINDYKNLTFERV